jgi:glycosyltransferase involved in cell wall biosynthesis
VIPLVSVITPTWKRPERLLNRCIPSVQLQTYRKVEHIIVSDGPDPELAGMMAQYIASLGRFYHPVRFMMLNPRPDPADQRCRARRAGIEAANGKYIAYLDDDDAYRPEHVQLHVKALEATPQAAWSYSVMASHSNSGLWTELGWGPPQYGQIGTPMLVHRAGLLDHGTWGPASSLEDWELIERWLAAGQEYVHVPEVTIDVWPSVYHEHF